jgi:hypothetical protein
MKSILNRYNDNQDFYYAIHNNGYIEISERKKSKDFTKIGIYEFIFNPKYNFAKNIWKVEDEACISKNCLECLLLIEGDCYPDHIHHLREMQSYADIIKYIIDN